MCSVTKTRQYEMNKNCEKWACACVTFTELVSLGLDVHLPQSNVSSISLIVVVINIIIIITFIIVATLIIIIVYLNIPCSRKSFK
jgi:hypothetical protein